MSNSLPKGVMYGAPVRLLHAASAWTQSRATPYSFNDVSPVLRERSGLACHGESKRQAGGESSESEILIIRDWINQGAAGDGQPEAAVVEAESEYRGDWWTFQMPERRVGRRKWLCV